MKKQQQIGGTVVGFIAGVVVGLALALAVAVYVTKVPVPFLNKGGARGADMDAAESQKNKNWDPNAPLYGKNPARPVTPQVPATPPAAPDARAQAPAPAPAQAPAPAPAQPESRPSADPLGDLAMARSAASPSAGSVDPFDYFVQAGAFRNQQDADAQRAKLAMLGWEARVSEREQNGRPVFRVRVGPFTKRTDAEQLKEKLDGAGVESALVRTPR